MKIEGFIVDIYSMSSADVTEVKRLEQECNLAPWSLDDYYAEVLRTDSTALAAKIEGEIVGFVVARLITNYDIHSLHNTDFFNEIEIYNLCVAQKYRRNNIGTALLYELLKTDGRKISSIWLDVRESNERARSFYNNAGFETICRRKNFYRNPSEDALLMKKSF